MKALRDVKYATPTPIAQNRHIVAMSLVRGVPLYQIYPKQLSVDQAADIYEQAIEIAGRLVKHGLVHCDLNEFNLLVDLSGIRALATDSEDPYVRHSDGKSIAGKQSLGTLSKPAWEQSLEAGDQIELPEPTQFLDNGEPKPVVTLIDFPQMRSTNHPNAQELYERDLACLRRFFELKLFYQLPDDAESAYAWDNVSQEQTEETVDTEARLYKDLKASGFSDDMRQDLELYYFESGKEDVSGVVLAEDDACSG